MLFAPFRAVGVVRELPSAALPHTVGVKVWRSVGLNLDRSFCSRFPRCRVVVHQVMGPTAAVHVSLRTYGNCLPPWPRLVIGHVFVDPV